jgi:hypothetical protein
MDERDHPVRKSFPVHPVSIQISALMGAGSIACALVIPFYTEEQNRMVFKALNA